MTEWQPIETAPKDGTEIVLHYKKYFDVRDFVVSGHWDERKYSEESTWQHSYGWGDADNWMPLPEPPK